MPIELGDFDDGFAISLDLIPILVLDRGNQSGDVAVIVVAQHDPRAFSFAVDHEHHNARDLPTRAEFWKHTWLSMITIWIVLGITSTGQSASVIIGI